VIALTGRFDGKISTLYRAAEEHPALATVFTEMALVLAGTADCPLEDIEQWRWTRLSESIVAVANRVAAGAL
jgi:hypothetical protein